MGDLKPDCLRSLMKRLALFILAFSFFTSPAFSEDEREWTVIHTLNDGSTYSLDKGAVEYLPGGRLRIWAHQYFVPTNPAEAAEMTALIEVDCPSKRSRNINITALMRSGELVSVDSPFTEPPYDWEPMNEMDSMDLLPFCK